MKHIYLEHKVCSVYSSNRKVFILSRVAELLNHKEKLRGCPLLDANKHTHTHIHIYTLRLP